MIKLNCSKDSAWVSVKDSVKTSIWYSVLWSVAGSVLHSIWYPSDDSVGEFVITYAETRAML